MIRGFQKYHKELKKKWIYLSIAMTLVDIFQITINLRRKNNLIALL